MPQIMVLADVFQNQRPKENRRIAKGNSFDESVDSRWLTFLLTNVRAAAEERNQLAGKCLTLPIRQRRPHSREQRDPQRLRQFHGRVAELRGRLQQMNRFDSSRRLEEFGLPQHQFSETLFGIEDRLLSSGRGSSGGGVQRVLLLEEGGGGRRENVAVFGSAQSEIVKESR